MALEVEAVNKLWQKALTKHEERLSTHPKAPKDNRWVVPTKDKSIEPGPRRRR